MDYIEVLKPLPSALLAFHRSVRGHYRRCRALSLRHLFILVAVLIASAGANGLTNYLDRDIDARMERTRCRVFPSRSIYPPEKAIALDYRPDCYRPGAGLAGCSPLAFAADFGGTLVAATWRKKMTCVYPQGVLASCAPILMGWLAVRSSVSWELLLLCVLIAAWLPLHVWSVNIAHREDYLQAGLKYFPMSLEVKDSVKVLLVFSLVLYAASIALYFIGGFAWLYLVAG